MATNDQVGGIQLLVDGVAAAQTRVGGIQLLVDGVAAAQTRVGGILVLVDATVITFKPYWAQRANTLIGEGYD